jgi:hypothetical protein
MKIFLFSFLILATCGKLYSQSCAQTLRLARSTYEQGRLHELPDLLASCIKNTGANGFTKEQKVQAYTLLTMAYIYLEEPEKADEAMLNLLRTDPYFKPNPDVDPAEFIGLYNTFRTRPVYRLGIKFSLNASQPNVSSYNPIGDGTAQYGYKMGFGGGFVAEVPITDRLTANGELFYTTKSFSHTSSSVLYDTTYSTSTGVEKQSYISLPLTVQYQIKKKQSRLNPYIVGGVATEYMTSASVDADQKRPGNQSIEVKSQSVIDQREKLNVSVLLGAGIKTRIAGGFLVAELRYAYGITKVNSPTTLLANQILLTDYKLSDGIFKMNSVYFNIGYVQNFFNPKKKLKKKK